MSASNIDNPLISAVITTHNRVKLVQLAIKSVQNQTYSNIELIVVDDASTDGTYNILSSLAEEQGFQYIYISSNESKGGNHARNIGIMSARGEYIAFLDDDDEWLPDKITKQISLLKNSYGCKVCYCGMIYDYNYGEFQRRSDVSKLPEGDLSTEIYTRSICLSSEMLVDRQMLLEIGMFDEKLSYWQDYELCMRLFQKTNVAVVRDDLVIYRIIKSDKNRLTNKIAGWEETVEYIYKKHVDKMNLLSSEERKRRDTFRYSDGAMRCNSCGDMKLQRKYLWKKFKVTHSLLDFMKTIFNVCRVKDIKPVKKVLFITGFYDCAGGGQSQC